MYLDRVVDRMFAKAPDRQEEIRTNPVTGGRWISGVDPVDPQKQSAGRALNARARFGSDNPGMPRLPLSYEEREDLKRGGLEHIVAWFARSLEALDYDCGRHPSFDEYACGVMASPLAPDFITHDPELSRRFPPRPLDGLGPGLCWRPARLPS